MLLAADLEEKAYRSVAIVRFVGGIRRHHVYLPSLLDSHFSASCSRKARSINRGPRRWNQGNPERSHGQWELPTQNLVFQNTSIELSIQVSNMLTNSAAFN